MVALTASMNCSELGKMVMQIRALKYDEKPDYEAYKALLTTMGEKETQGEEEISGKKEEDVVVCQVQEAQEVLVQYATSNCSLVAVPTTAAIINSSAVLTLDPAAAVIVTSADIVPDVSFSTLVNRTGQHIMISCCCAQKSLVTSFAVYLREKHGYDVWIDDVGSTICSKIDDGDAEKNSTEAVEKSHTILVFVSKEYNASEDCQKEAQYAHHRRDKGKVKIHYVMLQRDYTTTSTPDCIEGELALWIGNEKWYSLCEDSQVSSTGDALAELIGEQGKLVAMAVGGGMGAVRALSSSNLKYH